MAKVRRVFEIAKELGVASKAIVAKCTAEGVPGISNHMSTVKVGLEATIKEWFNEAASKEVVASTAVETADKVDLTKARKARRRRKLDTTPDNGGGDMADTEAAVAVAPEPTAVEAPPVPETDDSADTAAGADVAAQEGMDVGTEVGVGSQSDPVTPAAETGGTVAASAAAEAPPAVGIVPSGESAEVPGDPEAPGMADVQAVGKPNVPDRPKVVMPAGNMLQKPKEAQLKGPRVVRIEQPDVVNPPRPKRAPPTPGGRGVSGPTAGSDPSNITHSRGPVRGRGAGDDKDQSQSRAKRRTLSSRRGRSADALPTGPSKFSQADIEELDARLRGATGFLKQRRRDMRRREQAPHLAASAAVTGGVVEIAEPITIKSLSAATGLKSSDVVKYLFQKEIMATINSTLDADTAMEVCLENNIELVVKESKTAEQLVVAEFETRETIDERRRFPVVTVLGHVDHGKTSLLDRIRKSDVALGEDGGITQHVGAHRVTFTGGEGTEKTVVFLDTPGHEAFTSMRARGASMTDLIVLVVAADDGVMPQTVESISHARAAEVPIIVALNKIDVPQADEANIRKIYGQLAEHGLNPVEWGGDTEIVKTSAEEGTGITELLDTIDYQAELLELSADYGGSARGVVIETEIREGRGPVARVLVQQGQMKVGDFIVVGRAFGRVRDMTEGRGRNIRLAEPATPLELSGIDVVPDAGDKFYVTDTLQKAEQIATQYRNTERQLQLANRTKVSLDNFSEQLIAGLAKEIRIVLKADAQGSVDVLRNSLGELATDEVKVRLLHVAVGGITDSDVVLADASDAVVIGFHVVASPAVRDSAEQRQVEIRAYRVIYELIDDVRRAMEGLLDPEQREETLGEAEVRQIFRVSKTGMVAGCLVTEGVVRRGALVRVVRDGVVVTDGRSLETLRRVKDDAREVRAGTECGIRVEGFDDVKPGDLVACYNTVEVKRTLG